MNSAFHKISHELPQDFNRYVEDIIKLSSKIDGHLTEKEVQFLCLLGAFATTFGEVLEIGSFKGKSTIILAKSIHLIGGSKVIAVDPLILPSNTDP